MARETPVFPGAPIAKTVNWAASATTKSQVSTTDASAPVAITEFLLYAADATVDTTWKLFYHDGTNSRQIAEWVIKVPSDTKVVNLLQSKYIPSIDDRNPVLHVGVNGYLELQPSATAGEKNVKVVQGSYA